MELCGRLPYSKQFPTSLKEVTLQNQAYAAANFMLRKGPMHRKMMYPLLLRTREVVDMKPSYTSATCPPVCFGLGVPVALPGHTANCPQCFSLKLIKKTCSRMPPYCQPQLTVRCGLSHHVAKAAKTTRLWALRKAGMAISSILLYTQILKY